MLTTLSTVGYGDYYPYSMSEKIFGCVLQILGVTLFSIVMNQFTTIYQINQKDQRNEHLYRWFKLIKRIRTQPNNEGRDVPVELKREIELHFRHFWENDRVAALLEKKEYFYSIPFNIQDHIMCQFLFEDIFKKTAF